MKNIIFACTVCAGIVALELAIQAYGHEARTWGSLIAAFWIGWAIGKRGGRHADADDRD